MKKYIAIAVLSLFATLASAQTGLPPVYCQAEVIKAMRTIFNMSGNGTLGIETTFILNGTPDAYQIEIEKSHNERGMQSIYARRNTFAIFHVHPNFSSEFPSTPTNNYMSNGKGDTGMADELGVDVYVVSGKGLTVYYSATKKTVKLREGFSWASPKGCF